MTRTLHRRSRPYYLTGIGWAAVIVFAAAFVVVGSISAQEIWNFIWGWFV